jgi:hypothetical protein
VAIRTAIMRGVLEAAAQDRVTLGRRLGRLLSFRLGSARRAGSLQAIDDVLALEIAQNARTWATLGRLGVVEGTELALDFFYETGGPEADQELAAFLRSEAGYEVAVEPEGVTGRTPSMPVSAATLDAWVATMLRWSWEHGGCAFAGWTATVRSTPGP